MEDILTQVINFVNQAFNHDELQVRHFDRAAFWIGKFIPNCQDEHKIAAYAHDIERAFRDESVARPDDYLDPEFLKFHQEKGAEIIGDFLKKLSFGSDKIAVVTHMISRHELGGDFNQNAIMDADSASWFETAAELFVLKRAKLQGYHKIKDRLDWMYNRISSDERKGVTKELYIKWNKQLEDICGISATEN